MTSYLSNRTSGSNEIGSKQPHFAAKQWNQGGIRKSASKVVEIDWGNSQGWDGICFHCRCAGDVMAKCIAGMPQDVKNNIVSSAMFAKENEEEPTNDATKVAAFTRDNLHMFALMANALGPVHDSQDEASIAQNLMEYTHLANTLSISPPNPDIQWECYNFV